jgi:hypothetical protein
MNVLCALENVWSVDVVCTGQLVRSPLRILCLVSLPVIEREMLRFPAIINFSILPQVFLIYFGTLVLGASTLRFVRGFYLLIIR